MTCRDCGREIPENSIYCNWCGAKQLRERKRRGEVKVPAPKQLPSGSWTVYLRAEGQSVTEPTRELCLARARALRAGFVEAQAAVSDQVSTLIDNYISSQSNILSPSTIVGYKNIRKKRFPSLMAKPARELTPMGCQTAINAEAKSASPKTVKNAWALVAAALSAGGCPVPSVTLPRVTSALREWLDYEQITLFCDAIRGSDVELPALLALLSLRRSEVCALRWKDVDLSRKVVHVRGAKVDADNGKFVVRKSTKTSGSMRDVPLLIPRAVELLKAANKHGDYLVTVSPRVLGYRINQHCAAAGLPAVGVHGLRHSFASLAYHLGIPEAECMQMGGWSSVSTMRKVYTHIAAQDAEKHAAAMAEFYKNADENADA